MINRRFFGAIVFGIIFCLISLSLIELSSATISYYSLNLSSHSYSQGQQLNGAINLTLSNQESTVPVQYYIDSTLRGQMDLFDFINKSGITKICDVANCDKKYTISGSGTTALENFAVQNGTMKAFYITGENIVIKDFSFDISGESTEINERCLESAFKMDLLSDGVLEYEFKDPGQQACALRHSGENLSLSGTTENAYITREPICEKIKLGKTGEVEISAPITSGGTGVVIARVYNELFNEIGNCTMWPDGEQYSCRVNNYESPDFFINEEKYYYVCLDNPESDGISDYQIISESNSPHSGFITLNSPPVYNVDFAIYAREFSFLPFNTSLTFNNEFSLNNDLKQYIQNYISSKYSNNCSSGCVIPIQFLVNDPTQKINITNIKLNYNRGTLAVYTDKIYDITTTWPKINVTNQMVNFAFLNVSANLTPSSTTTHYFKIIINSISRQDSFKVETTPQVISLLPLQAMPGQSTNFAVVATPVSALRPIITYKWNFGDGSGEQITTTSTTSHTYSDSREYSVTITVVDNQSISGSKTFTVSTNLSADLVNRSLNEKIALLNAFAGKLESQDLWYSELYGINVTEKTQILEGLKTQINSTTPTSQLLSIKTQIDSVVVPGNITETYSLQDSPYFSSPDYVYPEYIARLTESEALYDVSFEDQYKNAIASWEENNLYARISGSVKALDYFGSRDEKATLFTVSIDPTATEGLGETYFVLKLPAGVSYSNLIIRDKDSFNTVDLNDAIGLKFDSLSEKKYIYFAMPGRQDLTQMNFFVSPPLSEFEISGGECTGDSCKPKEPPWVLIIIVICLIVLGIGAALFFIWKGHMPAKSKEEDLFKNKNDLYTLTNYISSNISRGINKEVILMQLMKAGWSKEQIDYAFKKSKK